MGVTDLNAGLQVGAFGAGEVDDRYSPSAAGYVLVEVGAELVEGGGCQAFFFYPKIRYFSKETSGDTGMQGYSGEGRQG